MYTPISQSQTLITGVYRSGTEYITQLINCHPHLSATMYRVDMLRYIGKKFSPISSEEKYSYLLDTLNSNLLKYYGASLNICEIKKSLAKYPVVSYGVLYDVVMSSLYLQPPISHWAEKNQLLWREIPEFISMMPNGKAILVIRDPRSVLASFKLFEKEIFKNIPSPGYLGAVFNSLDAMSYGKKYLDAKKRDFLLIKYEEMARNPEIMLKEVWGFIGLSTNENVDIYDTALWVDAYDQPWGSNSSTQKGVAPFLFDINYSINAWKEILSIDEISLVEHVCGNLMETFGYLPVSQKSDINKNPILEIIKKDPQLNSFYNNWLLTGQGVEAFPPNPPDIET